MAQLLWQQRQDTGPAARANHGMAYMASAQRTILFGGQAWGPTTYVRFDDTWEWDGEGWVQVADTGPDARQNPQLEWDAARQVAVLFGGDRTVGGPANDTWEWDGSVWTQIQDVGPPADPYSVTMVYDSARELMLLDGGSAKPSLPGTTGTTTPGTTGGLGTWTWDGSAWTQVDDGGPTHRQMSALAFDSDRNRAVLFGGWVNNPLKDTWEWDGAVWKQAEDIGPPARSNHAMAWDGKSVLLFGGYGSGAPWYRDTWAWDGAHWRQRQDMGPQPRWGHAIVWDTARDRTVLFGGAEATGPRGDTWEAFET
jgi:hypothetical protein